MSDNKKYYYMRLKDNFFDSEEMKMLEALPDGYAYSNILLKLYLISLKHEGKLIFNEMIPYSAEMIAAITRHQVGTVEKALKLFQNMGLIEVLDNGAIYMMNIQELIGESSSMADRKREYRARIDAEKKALEDGTNVQTDVGQMSDKSLPEIRDKSIDNKKKERKNTTYEDVMSEYPLSDTLKEAVLEFIKMRKLLKSPMTDRALKLMLNKLFEMGKDDASRTEILNQSIINGWKSIYPLKSETKPKATEFNNFDQRKYDFKALEPELLAR